jgi:hypothetical protein
MWDVQNSVLDRRIDEGLHSHSRGANGIEEVELIRAVESVLRGATAVALRRCGGNRRRMVPAKSAVGEAAAAGRRRRGRDRGR